jgi:hypothetical protein
MKKIIGVLFVCILFIAIIKQYNSKAVLENNVATTEDETESMILNDSTEIRGEEYTSSNTTSSSSIFSANKKDSTNSTSSASSTSGSETCLHGSCTKKRLSGSKYCSSHTCAENGCYKEVNSANDRCSTHKQEYYDSLGIGDVDSVANCVVAGCNTDAYKDSKYCISHKCRKKGCTNGQYGGNKYCYTHCPHF